MHTPKKKKKHSLIAENHHLLLSKCILSKFKVVHMALTYSLVAYTHTLNALCSQLKQMYSFFGRFDNLTIANDTNHVFGRYCGEKSGQTLLVTGHYAVITFQTDPAVSRRGYLLVFIPVPYGE